MGIYWSDSRGGGKLKVVVDSQSWECRNEVSNTALGYLNSVRILSSQLSSLPP